MESLIKDRIRSLKKILQLTLNQKSIKILNDGRITIVCRFKPLENLLGSQTTERIKEKILTRINIVTGLKYRITSVQKEPSFCYNTYVRMLSISSASSQDRVKRFLKYFEKDPMGKFTLKSYSEITLVLHPQNKEVFQNFLFTQDNFESVTNP